MTAVGKGGTFTTSGSSFPDALSDAVLIGMLDLSRADTATGSDSSADHIVESVDADWSSPSTINWAFQSGDTGDAAFDFLQEGETLILTYTVTVTDDSGSAGDSSTDLTITITGTNDSPVISGGDDSSALTETNTTLRIPAP